MIWSGASILITYRKKLQSACILKGFIKKLVLIEMEISRFITWQYVVQAWKDIAKFLSNKLESIMPKKGSTYIIYPCHSYLDALSTTNLSSLKEKRTQVCCKYAGKMSQNHYPINFLRPKTTTSAHSYNLRPGDNNGNIVYADRSCCRTQHSGSFISFSNKYVNIYTSY